MSGFRFELDTFIKPTISPRLTILFKPIKNQTFSAGISVAYRPPSLIETYFRGRVLTLLPPPSPSPPPVTVIGSTNLSPEQIISFPAGYQGWFLRHRLRIRSDIFYDHISDLITPTDFGSSISFINGKEADIYGGELGVEFLATSWLTGFANYAYQDIHQTITGENRRVGPSAKINGGLRGEWNHTFTMELAIHYYGSVTYPLTGAFLTLAPFGVASPNPKIGEYTLVNLRVGYYFWNRQAELALSIFNALNDRHQEHPRGDVIGSRVMGWLTVQLPAGTFNPLLFWN